VNASAPTLLFVYGTLKRGGSNHGVLSDQSFVGEARTVPGFRLFDLGEYPGMIADQSSPISVTGEVWSVNDEALARLDAFEGVPEGLYRRVAIQLLEPVGAESVQTYLYNREIAGRVEIASGTWRDAPV
jgi:gamma-glutamylcyclotransferase (GGCT)/AIG2-like uncharacterized protein YtfP